MLGVQGGQRRVMDPMELEPQMVVSCHVVLGTELEPLLLFLC